MTSVPSAPTKSGVFWTQFSASAITGADGLAVDWTDHKAAHRAVSRLFSPRLPGDHDARRAGAGILYRLDVSGPDRESTVLVQSLVAPELTPGLSRTTEVSLRGWDIVEGTRVMFRVAVNPVTRTTRHYTDEAKTQVADWSNRVDAGDAIPRSMSDDGTPARDRSYVKRTARVVPVAEVGEWLNEKIGAALGDVEVINHYRYTSLSHGHKVVTDTFDGTATVVHTGTLNALRIAGVGRSRAYGCGLLTAVPVG